MNTTVYFNRLTAGMGGIPAVLDFVRNLFYIGTIFLR